MKIILMIGFIIFSLITSLSYSKTELKCYGGKLIHKDVKDINEVHIGLSKNGKKSSVIIFTRNGKKYLNDIFCKENHIGRCGLLDDSGSIEILSKSDNKLSFQFDGMPTLVERQGETSPVVESSDKLKEPIHMNLSARPTSECVVKE